MPDKAQPERVLMTTDTVGGVWTFCLELAAELSARGVEIALAALGGWPSRAQSEEAAAIPNLRLFASDYKLEWMADPWEDVASSGLWLLGLEREFSPDVIHLNSFGHGALPWFHPIVLAAHSCVASWWNAVKHEPLPDEWSRYRALVERSLHSVERIITPSQAMRATLARDYQLPRTRIEVIANGRSPAAFFREEKEPIVLTAGRLWDDAKNVAAVVSAAESLPWPVYLAGESRHPDGRSFNAPNCRLQGHLPAADLARLYAKAAIYTLPARYEPFGYSALEAALSGCAPVLGDITSLRETWGDAAIFVPPDDSAALARALRDLIGDPTVRVNLAARAYQRARGLGPAPMATRYLNSYRLAMKESCACAS
jgi:glycogen synthase